MKANMFKFVYGQAHLLRRSEGSIWGVYLLWGLTILLLLLAGVAIALGQPVPKVVVSALAVVALQAFLVWGPLIKAVPKLLTPHYAQLVPTLRSEVIGVVVTTWLVILLFFAASFGYISGQYTRAACITAMLLGGLALLSIHRVEGIFPYMLAIFMAIDRQALAGAAPRTSLGFLLVAAALTSAYAYYRLFPRGDRLWRSAAAIAKNKPTWLGTMPAGDKKQSAMFRRVYGLVLQHDCQTRSPSKGNLLWHALGQGAHWTTPVLGWLLMLAICVVGVKGLPLLGLSQSFWQGFVGAIVAVAILFGQLWHTQKVAMRIHATRTEQQLVRLTPAMPQNAALNRLFVRHVLCQSAGMFVLVMLTTAFAYLVAGESMARLLTGVQQACLAVLMSVGMLRWITRSAKPTSAWPAVMMQLQMVAVAAGFAAVNHVISLPWWVMSAASLLLAGVLLRRDVVKVLAGPVVLPLAKL